MPGGVAWCVLKSRRDEVPGVDPCSVKASKYLRVTLGQKGDAVEGDRLTVAS